MIIREKITKKDGSTYQIQYVKEMMLGKGAFAECFVGLRKIDKKRFAIKIISKKQMENQKAKQKIVNEIKLHKNAKHPNICELKDVFEDNQNIYILLQLCSNRSLGQMLNRKKQLSVPQVQFFIKKLVLALIYLHNNRIIHRDVKLGNLLIDQQMNLKLTDFGFATQLGSAGQYKKTVCGTPNYIAPQIIKSKVGKGPSSYSYEVDVWSSGVILYLLLIGQAPFQASEVNKTFEKIARAQFSFPQWFINEQAKDLIKKILVINPSQRYTFQQILNHQFMNPKQGIPQKLPNSCLNQPFKFDLSEDLVYIHQFNCLNQITIYRLSNGYIGTYEEDYQLLQNTNSKVLLQIKNNEIKQINNELNNDPKFITHRNSLSTYRNCNSLKCQPFKSIKNVIYLISQHVNTKFSYFLFTFSDGSIQIYDCNKNLYLLISNNKVMMIKIQKGQIVQKIVKFINNYQSFPTQMKQFYQKVKKYQINSNN